MKQVNSEFMRFLIVGCGSNFLNFAVYYIAYSIIANLVIASIAGYLAGIFNSYYFGKVWVFGKGSKKEINAIFFFLTVYIIGGVGMTFIIKILNYNFGFDYRLSWLFGATFAFLNNFLGSKLLVFKK